MISLNFYSLRNYGFCQKEVFRWKVLIAVEKKISSHIYHFTFVPIYSALIDTIQSTALHPKCKHSGSSLLSLLIAAHPAFMVHQVEAAWLKSEGPSLALPICSILKAFSPQPVCVPDPSFCCQLIMFSNTHLHSFVKNAPCSWKLVLWIYKDTTLTSLETLLLTHFALVLPDTNSGVAEVPAVTTLVTTVLFLSHTPPFLPLSGLLSIGVLFYI